VGQNNKSRAMRRRFFLTVLTLAICAASGTGACAQDRLSKYQTQYDAEENPAKRAKILGQMGPLEVSAARTSFKADRDEQALDILTHYRDLVQQTMTALTGSGVDAVKRPAGFKELQIGLRVSVRQLDDLIMTIPVDKRPFFRAVRSDLADTQNKLIDLLFPTSDKSLTKKE